MIGHQKNKRLIDIFSGTQYRHPIAARPFLILNPVNRHIRKLRIIGKRVHNLVAPIPHHNHKLRNARAHSRQNCALEQWHTGQGHERLGQIRPITSQPTAHTSGNNDSFIHHDFYNLSQYPERFTKDCVQQPVVISPRNG